MKDYLILGATPAGENCAQVGRDNYPEQVRREGHAYIAQLTRMFGEPPTGSRFSLKGFPHDFGTYHEVVVWFDDTLPSTIEFAYHVENNLPEEWDDEAKEYLAEVSGLVREP